MEASRGIAMKLNLEESLVLTLPKMTRKGSEGRTPLVSAAVAILDDTLMKHADALRTRIATAIPLVAAKAEAVERTRAARDEAAGRRALGAQAACLMEADLAKLNAELELAKCDLQQFCDGPLAAFRTLMDDVDERQYNNPTVGSRDEDSMHWGAGRSDMEVCAKVNGACCELQQRS
jgi:hypothetical protein